METPAPIDATTILRTGISLIPRDRGFLAPLQIQTSPSVKGDCGIALIGCWYGHSEPHLKAVRTALAWTLRSSPMPQLFMVEATPDGRPRYFQDLQTGQYIPRTILPESEGIWLKESLWSIGARIAMGTGYRKLVFLDLDCSFAHQNWLEDTAKALDSFDVISPHFGHYYSGQKEGVSLGLKLSKGYTISTRNNRSGFPGMALGMTADFFNRVLKGTLAYTVGGGGDTLFWRRLFKGMPPRIGHGNQLLVHYPHGSLALRNYRALTEVVNACFPEDGGGLRFLPDGMPTFTDSRKGMVLRKVRTTIQTSGRAWTTAEAGSLCRQLLQAAGLQ